MRTGCVCAASEVEDKEQACSCEVRSLIERRVKRPIVPDRAEIRSNPAARSAKLRIVERHLLQ